MSRWRKPAWMRGLRVSRRVVVRFEIEGPEERSQEIRDAFPSEHGWRIVRSGPYTNQSMHPRIDRSRFKMVVEGEAVR